MLVAEPLEPPWYLACFDAERVAGLSQFEEVPGMRCGDLVRVPSLREVLCRILAHRLEQAVAHLAAAFLGVDERGVDQALDQLERALIVTLRTHGRCGREREAAREDG